MKVRVLCLLLSLVFFGTGIKPAKKVNERLLISKVLHEQQLISFLHCFGFDYQGTWNLLMSQDYRRGDKREYIKSEIKKTFRRAILRNILSGLDDGSECCCDFKKMIDTDFPPLENYNSLQVAQNKNLCIRAIKNTLYGYGNRIPVSQGMIDRKEYLLALESLVLQSIDMQIVQNEYVRPRLYFLFLSQKVDSHNIESLSVFTQLGGSVPTYLKLDELQTLVPFSQDPINDLEEKKFVDDSSQEFVSDHPQVKIVMPSLQTTEPKETFLQHENDWGSTIFWGVFAGVCVFFSVIKISKGARRV